MMSLLQWRGAGGAVVLVFVGFAIATRPAAASLFEALSELDFLNNGTVHSSDEFVWQTHTCEYLEPANVTRVRWHRHAPRPTAVDTVSCMPYHAPQGHQQPPLYFWRIVHNTQSSHTIGTSRVRVHTDVPRLNRAG